MNDEAVPGSEERSELGMLIRVGTVRLPSF